MCEVGVDRSAGGHQLIDEELSAFVFIGALKEFSMSCYDASKIGMPLSHASKVAH